MSAREKGLFESWPIHRPRMVKDMYARPKKNTFRIATIDGNKTVKDPNA